MIRRCAFAAVVLLVAAGGCDSEEPGSAESVSIAAAKAASGPRQELRRTPPRVVSMTAQLLEDPKPNVKALLRVRFAQDESLPPRLRVHLEGESDFLRDDGRQGDEQAGDGTYSLILDLDLGLLEKNQNLYLRFDQGPQSRMPIFDRRVLKGSASPAWIDFLKLRRGDLIPFPDIPLPPYVDADRSLLIRDLAVVEDPARTFNVHTGSGAPFGKWTFGYLMQQMANELVTGIDPRSLVREWLEQWGETQAINGWDVPARPHVRNFILAPWETASGGPGMPLDLGRAPFRLLAIVNRIDLAQNLVYGGGSGGELRFVFCAVDPATGLPAELLVIFEYGVRQESCESLRDWARRWVDLSALALGSASYSAALEALTEQVVRAGVSPLRTNGSSLNQLRTNHHPSGTLWELREFRLSKLDGMLRGTTVKQTPASSLADSDVLASFINAVQAELVAGTAVVPLKYPPGSPFRGGSSVLGGIFHWEFSSGRVPNREALHQFSFNTCNGCHARETGTPFMHVGMAGDGELAPLSGFLTGISLPDWRDGSPTRVFNDLLRRRLKLVDLAHKPCFLHLWDIPLLMEH
jgi:hypothetical protein